MSVAALLALLPACRGCKSDPGASHQAAASAREIETRIPAGKRFEPPKWTAQDPPLGIGLPSGCALEPPVQTAPLPIETRFVAARHELGWLAFRTDSGERALVDLTARRAVDVPWMEFDDPPLLEQSASTWVAALSNQGRALLWRGGERDRPLLELVRGDRLAVADVACSGERCALLSTLARSPIAPGATLAVGDPRRAESWTALDLEIDPDAPWHPLAIARMTEREIVVALASDTRVAFIRVDGDKQERLGEVTTPLGAWDVIATPAPLVIMPGRVTDGGCTIDEFPLKLVPLGQEPLVAQADVAPSGVIARSLDKGALIAWIAPVSCLIPSRTVVRLLVLDEKGAPRSAPMGVADASGFALATEGNRLSLWLRTPSGITWIRARCG